MENNKKIMIIDDDVSVSESLRRLLSLSNYEVKVVNKAKEAFEEVKLFKPDLIILDLLMPGVGGFELCEMFNKDKETNRIPIIVVSALGSYTDIKKAYTLGVVGYITKPYDFNHLLREIEKILITK